MRRKKLYGLLRAVPFEQLVFAVWDIRQAQSQNDWHPKLIHNMPSDWLKATIGDRSYFYPWTLEALVNLALENELGTSGKKGRWLDLRYAEGFFTVWKALRNFEDVEESIALKRADVFQVMFRLTRRQFEWQQGFWNAPRILLYLSIFGGPKCRAAFRSRYSFELETFFKFVFVVAAILSENSKLTKEFDGSAVGIDQETQRLCWPLISASAEVSRARLRAIRTGYSEKSYAPSILREAPCIDFGTYVIAPLVECLYSRMTDGIYYDVVKDGAARDEFGRKFEEVISNLIASRTTKYTIRGEIIYGKESRKTPDLFVLDHTGSRLVIEAKATKISSKSRFNTAPVVNVEDSFHSIAKAHVQLWRFVQHSVEGVIPSIYSATANTRLMIVALEQWIGPETGIDRAILELANRLADEEGVSRDSRVRRAVHFATVADLHYILGKGTTEELVDLIDHMETSNYTGWMASKVFDEVFGKRDFDDVLLHTSMEKLELLLPWLNEIKGKT
ncbi:MAG: hypothetical protein KGO53_13985 [Alphaproteobacteria bacterium]|nr:hypothetical protein [Alphaproteobacteria bacterium]